MTQRKWDSRGRRIITDDYDFDGEEHIEWTDADEAGLEEHEERKRQRLAEANEY